MIDPETRRLIAPTYVDLARKTIRKRSSQMYEKHAAIEFGA